MVPACATSKVIEDLLLLSMGIKDNAFDIGVETLVHQGVTALKIF